MLWWDRGNQKQCIVSKYMKVACTSYRQISTSSTNTLRLLRLGLYIRQYHLRNILLGHSN